MFEKASRLKLRYGYRGQCSTEDLWDLDVEDLDDIFKDLNAELKDQQGESLLETKSKADERLELKIAIIRRIVEVKLAEKKAREEEAMKAQRKQQLLALISEKQHEELKGKSIDELTAMIDQL